MAHKASPQDISFVTQFEAGQIQPAEFDHRAHLRLAYVYLTEHNSDDAYVRMKNALVIFLRHIGIEAVKYHDTMTRAWILAVRHFMEMTPSCASADAFIENNPSLLDPKIMLKHYSAELLFSDGARSNYVAPNISGIPRYDK